LASIQRAWIGRIVEDCLVWNSGNTGTGDYHPHHFLCTEGHQPGEDQSGSCPGAAGITGVAIRADAHGHRGFYHLAGGMGALFRAVEKGYGPVSLPGDRAGGRFMGRPVGDIRIKKQQQVGHSKDATADAMAKDILRPFSNNRRRMQ
jgi:hypothetical protein